ncbi:MAG: hypothetical protein ABSD31_21875 [Candidatus Binataceae bacterium]|jgi:hypothetical protein
MQIKRPHVATLDEVRITRKNDAAVIEYGDSRISTTHLKLGPEVQWMSDQQILDCFNDCIRTQEQIAAEYEHIAVEIPPGRPQIEYFEEGHQWTPRGDVLRCVISDGGPDNDPIIDIDDRELSWSEFGRLLITYAGWGLRIVFVPDDELHKQPRIEVREPEAKRWR